MPTHVISINGDSVDPTTGDAQVPIYKRKTILTDAQIKALHNSYVELVPAPGAAKAILLHSSLFHFNTTFGPYGNIDSNGAFVIVYGDYYLEASSIVPVNGGDYINILPMLSTIDSGSWSGYSKTYIGGYRQYFENAPLKLAFVNSTGDLTDGASGNYLEVTVFYSIVDL